MSNKTCSNGIWKSFIAKLTSDMVAIVNFFNAFYLKNIEKFK